VNASPSSIRCAACGWVAAARAYPFRCTHADGDDVDHVLVRVLDTATLRFPDSTEPNPFARYRSLMHSYHLAMHAGLDDEEYLQLIDTLDRSAAAVDGHGFRVTPLHRSAVLSDLLGCSPTGGVWVKDETGNVSGSHKGRHLMGLLIYLEIAERLGLAASAGRASLAIASCGNAALAAAVVAKAGERRLRVFVPVEADAVIVTRLRRLGSEVVTCPRAPGVPGDPSYLRLRRELAAGAVPFTCQGNENGLAIEGGETIAYELASQLAGAAIDHIVIQVGGGALASACAQGLREAAELRAIPREPRLHTVQTTGAHPLERAYHRVRAMLPAGERTGRGATGPWRRGDVERALATAARHRSDYMWPWESEPKSIATGILDDETYDWRAVVGAMLATGGQPVVVSEDRLAEANELAAATGIPVDPTGSAGLAGLLDLREAGLVGPEERVMVLFTGVRRGGADRPRGGPTLEEDR
jgi:threonine synthase